MTPKLKRIPATLSVDVDPVDAHLAGYGVIGQPPDSACYERAVPRLLEAFAAHGVRATFFWVARDAERSAAALRAVVAAGHEVASHSLTHAEAWRNAGSAEVAHELRESKQRLEQCAGASVVGFRSPGWHGPRGLHEELARAGYRYDASSFPSPLLGAMSALLFLGSRGRRRVPLGAGQWFAPRAPSQLARGLTEFPVSVTRRLRFPVYHTLRYSVSSARFERLLEALAREGHELSYPLHAVDALGLREDGIEQRLARHPGMSMALEEKLSLLYSTLRAIAERFSPAPYCQRLATLGHVGEPASA
ncbi:MAG: polysaccharide deacetylase family protein [Deltaproteobacteria bacterium]|nr:polysaccharide deacetylase family protein [Deltaproteobacteria bacterium]